MPDTAKAQAAQPATSQMITQNANPMMEVTSPPIASPRCWFAFIANAARTMPKIPNTSPTTEGHTCAAKKLATIAMIPKTREQIATKSLLPIERSCRMENAAAQ